MDAMVTNIGGNEIYEKHSVQMKGFVVKVVIDFFLFKSTNIQLNLASAVVSSQGGEFLMAAEPQQLQMWNPTTNFAPQLS